MANNASWQLPDLNDYADYTRAYDTEMGDLTRAEPFPDILSLSWEAHFLVPDTAREATMAKYASMGMTVLAASGDTGEWTGQICGGASMGMTVLAASGGDTGRGLVSCFTKA